MPEPSICIHTQDGQLSLFPHSLHKGQMFPLLIICCLTFDLVLMTCSCAAIIVINNYLFRSPFFNQLQVLSFISVSLVSFSCRIPRYLHKPTVKVNLFYLTGWKLDALNSPFCMIKIPHQLIPNAILKSLL